MLYNINIEKGREGKKEMFEELQMCKRDIERAYSDKIASYLLEGYSIVPAMLSSGTVYLANESKNEMIRITLHYYTGADEEGYMIEDGYMIKEDKGTVSKTFMFDNIECLHEIRYRAIYDENDEIQYYERHVIC